MQEKCVAGCRAYTGGEIKHHPDCPFYPESLSKMYDDLVNEKKIREPIDSVLPDDWVETKVDMTQITGGKLQDFINVLDDAIRYLENHHYNTAKLIESTQKILGTYDKKE